MDTSSPTHRLEEAIAQHFFAEKRNGLLLIGWSVIGLLIATFFYFSRFGKLELGVVFPVASIALVHLYFGVKMFFLSKRQLPFLRVEMAGSPKATISAEQVRVEKAILKFEKYRQVLLLLFLLGFTLVIGGTFCNMGDFTLGSGIGLTIQAALTLVFDLLAAYRTGFYQHELKVFMKSLS